MSGCQIIYIFLLAATNFLCCLFINKPASPSRPVGRAGVPFNLCSSSGNAGAAFLVIAAAVSAAAATAAIVGVGTTDIAAVVVAAAAYIAAAAVVVAAAAYVAAAAVVVTGAAYVASAAGIAAGIGNKVREPDPSHIGTIVIAGITGHRYSSIEKIKISRRLLPPRHSMRLPVHRSQPAADNSRIIQPRLQRRCHGAFRPDQHVLPVCHSALYRRNRAIPQIMDRRCFLFLLHTSHPAV